MKISLVLNIVLVSLLFLEVGCKGKNEDSGTAEIEGTWKVISFEDYANDSVIYKTNDNTWTQYNQGDNTISFVLNASTNGGLSGVNVTNTFSGDFLIDEAGHIYITNVEWTKINEPYWAALMRNIEDAESFEIEDGILIIFYNAGQNSITLEKA